MRSLEQLKEDFTALAMERDGMDIEKVLDPEDTKYAFLRLSELISSLNWILIENPESDKDIYMDKDKVEIIKEIFCEGVNEGEEIDLTYDEISDATVEAIGEDPLELLGIHITELEEETDEKVVKI